MPDTKDNIKDSIPELARDTVYTNHIFGNHLLVKRNSEAIPQATSILLISLFLICFPFFLFKLNYFYPYYTVENTFLFYLITLLIILIVYSFKFSSLIAISSLFDSREVGEEYINHTFLSLKAIGLFIFPILVLLEFSEFNPLPIVISGLFICLLFYSVRVSRGIFILLNEKVTSFSHIFLYFCTFEILPLVVIIKLLMSGVMMVD